MQDGTAMFRSQWRGEWKTQEKKDVRLGEVAKNTEGPGLNWEERPQP